MKLRTIEANPLKINRKQRYHDAADYYTYMMDFVKFVMENSTCPDKVELQKQLQPFVRKYRDKIQSLFYSDPLAKPLTEEFRGRAYEDGYSKEYGILPEDGYTSDEEIEQYIRDYIELPPINSPYDCTGKIFTASVHWKRTKAGITIIHSTGLDI